MSYLRWQQSTCLAVHNFLSWFTVILFISIIENLFYSLVYIYINFCSNRWIYSHWVCISSGFTMYFVGSSQVYLMCVISLLRYYMVKVIESSIPMIYVKYSIGFCILLSLFWSSMPIVGWNYYSLEGTINFFSKTMIY